ncbi:MAG: phenylacetic acid degradation operon negative regulatory protein PaaX [Alphaproteobacteria bacterium]|nr:phenylacetic acid degradation operon negative regulatory protein PaaX [Alphaproteobacteria bacterium]
MNAKPRLIALTHKLLAELKPRAKSLIVTVYGDAIGPHGGTVWLGNLIGLMEPLGMSERMVRTAVFRLIKDEWLKATPIGRRSTYGLTEIGWRRFEAAYRRIYAPLEIAWDGDWHLVLILTGGVSTERRDLLRNELAWQGFGQVGPNLLAHPNADAAELAATLDTHEMIDDVVVMKSRHVRPQGAQALKELVRESWDLDGLSKGYQGFLSRFKPVLDQLAAGEKPDSATAFALRILMLHDFRRVLLRDPLLPSELLPEKWAGTQARRLCKEIYTHLHEGAEAQLMNGLETAEGPLPPLHPSYFFRFGGILR